MGIVVLVFGLIGALIGLVIAAASILVFAIARRRRKRGKIRHFLGLGLLGAAGALADGRDRLRLDDALWGEAELTAAEIMDFAEIEGDDLVFSFGEGNSLRLQDFTDTDAVEAVLGFF